MAESHNVPKARALGYLPQLDGLRALAVILVILSHGGVPYMARAGTVGVTVFFVLSGFLITRLMADEMEFSGTVSLRGFYVRRVLRLMPGALVMLSFVAIYQLFTGGSLLPPLLTGLYVANFGSAVGVMMGPLAHAWSLSQEEQFYLVWPIVFLAIWKRRFAVPLLGTAIIASAALRIGLWFSGSAFERVYFAPDTRADALLIGCLLGLTIHRISTWPGRAPAAAVSLAVLVGAFDLSRSATVITLLPVAVGAAALIAWLVQDDGGVVRRALSAAPVVFIGKISYGLYLWHYPVLMIITDRAGHPLGVETRLPLMVAGTLLISVGSWFLLERPCLNLKRRFAPRRNVPVLAFSEAHLDTQPELRVI